MEIKPLKITTFPTAPKTFSNQITARVFDFCKLSRGPECHQSRNLKKLEKLEKIIGKKSAKKSNLLARINEFCEICIEKRRCGYYQPHKRNVCLLG